MQNQANPLPDTLHFLTPWVTVKKNLFLSLPSYHLLSVTLREIAHALETFLKILLCNIG